MATKDEVGAFLKELQAIGKAGEVIFIDRDKNKQALLDLEISPKQREEYIKKLTINNYSEGPLKNDQYGNNPNWVFGIDIKSREIYIKINLNYLNIICVSFHIAEHPMNYPFKQS